MFKMRPQIFVVLAIAALLAEPASAQNGLPEQCLQSFNVKDKGYPLGSQMLSCKSTEVKRGELFSKINDIPETGEIDGGELASELMVLESKLAKDTENNNWFGIGNAVTGNALATIGLSACLKNNKAECALAIVGKISSLLGIIDSATSETDRVEAATSIRKEIERIRVANQNKKSKAKALRDRMISEFTQMCDAVRENCL